MEVILPKYKCMRMHEKGVASLNIKKDHTISYEYCVEGRAENAKDKKQLVELG